MAEPPAPAEPEAEPEGEPVRRRRGSELERAIFDAVWAELDAVGYERLTMEGVAARAQTGKQVLYRRWPNRLELVLAAIRDRSGWSILDRAPDTGSLREDAVTVLRAMAARQRDLNTVGIRGLLIDVGDLDPAALTQTAGLWTGIVERAAKRGEIGTAPVPWHVIAAASELLRHRILISSAPVTGAEIDRLVDDIFLPLIRFHAARAQTLRS